MDHGTINILEYDINNYLSRLQYSTSSHFSLNRGLKDAQKPMRYKGVSIGAFDVEASDICEHTLKKLERKKVKIIYLPDQRSSDGLADHAGESDEALELVMKNIEAYEAHRFDYIINSTDGSGVTLKDYYKLFVPGTVWYDRAQKFSDRVIEGSEIMTMID
ncbi:(Fe-S)-binding protein [Salinicoccus albus]|uniref:(Fe-S)-binding protein n=1 Tax=Salinicoccus albus TaxID=418756 RepID=UPI00037D0944|nr:(Fe-S)-binding protein [Salinicoccus albus]